MRVGRRRYRGGCRMVARLGVVRILGRVGVGVRRVVGRKAIVGV
jgi:hypothetical protein